MLFVGSTYRTAKRKKGFIASDAVAPQRDKYSAIPRVHSFIMIRIARSTTAMRPCSSSLPVSSRDRRPQSHHFTHSAAAHRPGLSEYPSRLQAEREPLWSTLHRWRDGLPRPPAAKWVVDESHKRPVHNARRLARARKSQHPLKIWSTPLSRKDQPS